MSSHTASVLVYLAFVVGGAVVDLRSRSRHSRLPSFGELVTRAMRRRSGRVGIMAAWMWLGLHFFAR